VFTHLAPDDFVAMLRLTRRHVKTDGRLVFSLFLNDPDHPSPVALAVAAKLESDDPAVVAAVAEALAAKDRALELVEGTGWEIVSLNPPEPYIQHYLICRPV
jgi:hypothetical protein